MVERIQDIYRKSSSPKNFFEQLQKEDIETYTRRNKITGIYLPQTQRKMRLSSLGFDQQEILSLSKEYQIWIRLKGTYEKDNENELEL